MWIWFEIETPVFHSLVIFIFNKATKSGNARIKQSTDYFVVFSAKLRIRKYHVAFFHSNVKYRFLTDLFLGTMKWMNDEKYKIWKIWKFVTFRSAMRTRAVSAAVGSSCWSTESPSRTTRLNRRTPTPSKTANTVSGFSPSVFPSFRLPFLCLSFYCVFIFILFFPSFYYFFVYFELFLSFYEQKAINHIISYTNLLSFHMIISYRNVLKFEGNVKFALFIFLTFILVKKRN